MSPAIAAVIFSGLLIVAILIGRSVRRWLPAHHLDAATKETVTLAIGLIASMAALLLGLLMFSAKNFYEGERTQVIQMTAKVSYVNLVLSLYGPETMDARKQFRAAVEDAIRRLWPKDNGLKADSTADVQAGNSVYMKIEALSPTTDAQRKLKGLAEAGTAELAQLRSLLLAHSESSVSTPLLAVLMSWLVIIFASFSLFAAPNMTANAALCISALAVAGAIFLLLELDSPFNGILQIPNREMVNVLNQMPK